MTTKAKKKTTSKPRKPRAKKIDALPSEIHAPASNPPDAAPKSIFSKFMDWLLCR